MPQRDLVVIGASAGDIAALQKLVRALPGDFPAAILVVVHMSPHSPGLLPEILSGFGPLLASNARHGEPIENGHINVAPPNRHLLAGANRRIQIGHGPKENRFRPAVDPLFRSAAVNYGAQSIGIVLSGGLDDGTAGLCVIKQAGGLTIVQDPAEAEAPSMPRNALNHIAIDYCLAAHEIGAMLPQFVWEAPTGETLAMFREMAKRPDISNQEASDYSLRAELALKRAQLLRESIAMEPESEQTAGLKINN